MFDDWQLNQQNRITFVLVDSNNNEVAGLGSIFTLEISKNGGAFAASAGVKGEIGNGWYTYLATTNEANTVGPLSIRVTGAGIVQQNLEYVVKQRNPGAIQFTYTVTRSDNGNPLDGVEIWIATDTLGTNIVWNGVTDALGVARDSNSQLPYLDPGTYYFFRKKAGFSFSNPDTEVVSS